MSSPPAGSLSPFRLTVRDLACVRGGRCLFRDLDFILEAGGVLVLTGPNGAGKTSLLRILAGLLAPDTGMIRCSGDDEVLAEQSHFVGAAEALKAAVTVREHLVFWQGLLGGGATSQARALQRLGLTELADMPAGYLSSGQRRRLALARLLVAPRPLWLLDEPTNALDAAGRQILLGLIDEHRARGGAVVVATHEPLDLAGSASLALGARALEPLP